MRTIRALAIAGISFGRAYPQPRAHFDGPAPSRPRLQRDVPLPFRNSTSLDIIISDRPTTEDEFTVTSTVGDVSIEAITTHSLVGHTEEPHSITVVSTDLPAYATSTGGNPARTILSPSSPATSIRDTTDEGRDQPTTNSGTGAASSKTEQWSDLTTSSTNFFPSVDRTSGFEWHTPSPVRQLPGVSSTAVGSPPPTTSAKQQTELQSGPTKAPLSTTTSRTTLTTQETPAASALAATILATELPVSSRSTVPHASSSSSYSVPVIVSSTITAPHATEELITTQSTGSQRTAEATLSVGVTHSEQHPSSLIQASTTALKHSEAVSTTSMTRQSTRLPVHGDSSYNSVKNDTSHPVLHSLSNTADVMSSGSETTNYSKQGTTLATYIKTDASSYVTQASAGGLSPTQSIPNTSPTVTNVDSGRPERNKTMTTVGITTGAVSAGIMCGIVLFFVVGWYRRKKRHGGAFVPMLSNRGLVEASTQQFVQQRPNSHFALSWNQSNQKPKVRKESISNPLKVHDSLGWGS